MTADVSDSANSEASGRSLPSALSRAEGLSSGAARTNAESALMEQVVDRANLQRAYQRVKRNKGAPGIDGLAVTELGDLVRQHWPTIKAKLLDGTYQPQPVRRVTIPKPNGGERELGIPTVLDRLIQQALHHWKNRLSFQKMTDHHRQKIPGNRWMWN